MSQHLPSFIMKPILSRLFLIFSITLVILPVGKSVAEVRTFEFQGVSRLYWIGDHGAGKRNPLMVHLHGFRKREAAEKGKDDLEYILWDKMYSESQKNSFTVVQPAAFLGQWRLFPGVKNVSLETGEEVDDVGFIFALVQYLVDEGIADPKRIYLTGISDGGIMSFHLLCQQSSPFAAAVVIVGLMYERHM